MKKILKISAISLLVLIIILITVPFIFKGKINSIVKEQINNNLNAKVDYADFSMGIITSFPYFRFSMEDLYVAGINEFEGDTLLKFKKMSISLDLMSVIKMDDIKIRAISLEEPQMYALILPNGKANWDITKPSTDTTPADTSTSATKFSLKLKKFEMTNADIIYDDQQYKMYASMQDMNFLLKGDFTQDMTSLEITTTAGLVNYVMDNIKYLKDAKVTFDGNIDADMVNWLFTMKENNLVINDLNLGWNGTVSMKDTNIVVDMTYATKRTDFKSLLSLIPAVFMKDFESVQTKGNLKLDGYVRGTYNAVKMPNVGLTLVVDNAMFKYPDLPRSVENIGINVKIFFDGVQNDNTIIDVNKFHFEISKNPFDIVLNLKTPMSDPSVNAKFRGDLNLSSLKDVVPLDSMTLKGMISTNLDMMGQMSMIEKEKYEDFKAEGSLKLYNIEYSSPDFPQGITINKTTLTFTPKVVDLAEFDAVFGKSDIKMTGKLENFIPYALKGKTLKATMTMNSNIMDLNQFLSSEEEPAETATPTDTAQMTIFEVPKNINFEMKSSMGQIYYDKLVIKNLMGMIRIADGTVILEKLNMNMLEGSMKLSGEYNTQDLTKPFVDFDIDITDFDIPSSFVAFNTVQKLAPIAENAKGKFSMGMAYKSELDKNMNPIMKTMSGNGSLSSKSVEVMNSKTFSRIADAMKNDNMKNIKLSDVAFDFEIKDGRVYVDPFDTKMGSSKLKIFGDNGLDQSINYVMKVAVPRSELGNAANQVVNNLATAASSKGIQIKPGEFVDFDVKVGGTILDPKVLLDLLTDKSSMKDQAKNVVSSKIDDGKNQAKAAASKEAEKILADAQKQADAIKAEAAKAAELVKKEAYANADKIEKEAAGKPKFAKDVAKKLADKTRKEGDAKAAGINSEAAQKADAVMNAAKAKADKLK